MTETKEYKCVNCGKEASALYRTYGPTVLKLTKCENCKGIVDKYIEYDPVIVMIDLVLMSKEAQRHVLYNTEFKSFWKLLVILAMLETYAVWQNRSLFKVVVTSLCGIPSRNSTEISLAINISLPEPWNTTCLGWAQEDKVDNVDLFIWEKDFYVQFISIFAGITAFILTARVLMRMMKCFSSRNEVSLTSVLKAFSLANVSILLSLPMLVWGSSETSPDTIMVHYLLVFGFSFVMFFNVFTVLYECPMVVTIFILILSNAAKFVTSFYTTPQLRSLVS